MKYFKYSNISIPLSCISGLSYSLSGNIVPGYENFVDELKLMQELSNIYDKSRIKRNCIDFDIPDIKV